MGIFRRKINQAVSQTAGERTKSPLHGTFVDSSTLQNISETNFRSWVLKRAEQEELEPTEENYPEPWRAGRELARAHYAERLRKVEPIPKEAAEVVRVATLEAIALNNALMIALRMGIDNEEIQRQDVDPATLGACTVSFGEALMRLFNEHRNA